MTLYDQFNNPIDLTALKEEHAAPTVTGVRSIISGHPSAGLTPPRLARLLRSAEDGNASQYLELAEDMEEKDLHYRGVISTRKLQVSQLDVTVIPAGEDAEDVRNADLIKAWLDKENRQEEFFDILDAIGKGYSVQEIEWDMSESQWEPKRLTWRDPRWFEYDRADGTTLLLRDEAGQLTPMAPYKFVVHAHKSKSGLPIRSGLARAAAWCYLFKNYDIKGWVAFAEVYGQPLRLGQYHPGASEEEKKALLSAVANISRDSAAIIPESMQMEFVKSEIKGSTDLFERLANYMDTQVSKLVLGQTTTTDAISGGHAVSKEHNEVREDIERADAKQLAAAVNRDVVHPYIDLNFGPQKRYPRIRIGRPEEVDVPQVIKAVKELVPVGFRIPQKPIRDLLGLPEAEEGDEVFTVPSAPTAEPQPEPEEEEDAQAKAKTEGSTDPLEALLEGLVDNGSLGEAMDPAFAPIEDLLASSASYEEFTEGLAGLVKDMDTDKMTELLARSTFATRIAGEAGLEIEDDG